MKTCRILLIDDDVEDFLIMQEALEELDALETIQYADGGPSALRLLNDQYVKGEGLPQIILLDLNMPALNGTSMMRLLNSDPRFQDIPVVIYSTAIDPRDEAACRELGAKTCIVKPNTMGEIRKVGAMLLDLCNERSGAGTYPPVYPPITGNISPVI